MPQDLRILFLEDSEEDMSLEERALRNGGLAFTSRRVETVPDLKQELQEFAPHLVISDYSMPQLNGLDALRITHELKPELPFIFVSGTIGEERAIESLKAGATDYVVKDRLPALVSKVRRALDEQERAAERKRLEEQLRRAQKMDAIGRLAGGVAHDFNNLLTVINGYSELVLSRLSPESPDRSALEQIQLAGQRAAALTRQLLAFSRKQESERRSLDLNTVIRGITTMLRRLIGSHITLESKLHEPLGTVFADPTHVEQVIINLVVNARDAMPNGGTITIETDHVQLAGGEQLGFNSGVYIKLAVTDTGVGMSEEVKSHLFEPFFTTKEPGKGTGLGLSTVHGIVKQSNGHIDVVSASGAGSTFAVYLPWNEGTAPASSTRPIESTQGGMETILVAEDSEPLRRLAQGILQSAGYTVITAESGEASLQLLQQHKDAIHVLVTDAYMPGMTGLELAQHALRSHPKIKVLIVSGDTEQLPEGYAFLPKPYSIQRLLAKIRELLES